MLVDLSLLGYAVLTYAWQYIAKKLFEINERGTYENPAKLKSDDPESKAKLLAQEEEIFQIARLINAGWFASGEPGRLVNDRKLIQSVQWSSLTTFRVSWV